MSLKNRTLLLLLVFFLSACTRSCKEDYYARQYDQATKQQPIVTQQGIDSVLSQLETIPFKKLDSSYLRKTNTPTAYKQALQSKHYYVIRSKEIFQFLVGPFRIHHFMPKDDYYDAHLNALDAGKEQYWLIDKKVLHRLLDLQNELRQQGHDPYAYRINNGFRHPAYNKKVGGASKSRHLFGQAIDMHILDINRDGKANDADKQIVLDILENKVIKSTGGIGRYPGTQVVHFDVRGYRARWDKQK